MEAILVLAVLGFIGAVIARAKGGSQLAGFVLGFFLGPIGWLLYLLMGGAKQKKCPKCAENVKAAATVCKHCGHSFAAARS